MTPEETCPWAITSKLLREMAQTEVMLEYMIDETQGEEQAQYAMRLRQVRAALIAFTHTR